MLYGVTPVVVLLMQKISAERYINLSDSHSRVLIRFRNLPYRIIIVTGIRRCETEGIVGSAVAADNDIHLRIGLDWDQAIKKSQPSKLGQAACSAVELHLR